MDDRRLLEIAAKAAGLRYDAEHELVKVTSGWETWNPFLDDDSALRLADKLDLCIERYDGNATIVGNEHINHWPHEPDGDDRAAATRRAIVRAAAAIGEKMP